MRHDAVDDMHLCADAEVLHVPLSSITLLQYLSAWKLRPVASAVYAGARVFSDGRVDFLSSPSYFQKRTREQMAASDTVESRRIEQEESNAGRWDDATWYDLLLCCMQNIVLFEVYITF